MLVYLTAVVVVLLLVAMVVFAPPAIHEAMRGEYETFVRNLLAIAGPTAAAAVGDLALSASRPPALAVAPRNVRRAYLVSRWASWLLFGMIGGGGVQVLGWPPLASWMAAGVFGALGTNVVNIIFNRLLDRAIPAPPAAGAGGEA